MMRDRVLESLRGAHSGVSIGHVLAHLRIDPYGVEASAVEALLFLSPEVRLIDGKWRAVERARGDRIVTAIESYASATGKRLFRASAALDGIPIADQPTVEELEEILSSTGGKFSLLPNAMIKRNE